MQHETTDTDETEFRPAKAARDGNEHSPGTIPDGFYLVGDETNLQSEWHAAMIAAVKEVTHIAPADEDGKIIGETVVQEGVIAVPKPSSLGLCSGVTNAEYATTTEVYPDSPNATDEQCNQAQVACVTAGLEYIIKAKGLDAVIATAHSIEVPARPASWDAAWEERQQEITAAIHNFR